MSFQVFNNSQQPPPQAFTHQPPSFQLILPGGRVPLSNLTQLFQGKHHIVSNAGFSYVQPSKPKKVIALLPKNKINNLVNQGILQVKQLNFAPYTPQNNSRQLSPQQLGSLTVVLHTLRKLKKQCTKQDQMQFNSLCLPLIKVITAKAFNDIKCSFQARINCLITTVQSIQAQGGQINSKAQNILMSLKFQRDSLDCRNLIQHLGKVMQPKTQGDLLSKNFKFVAKLITWADKNYQTNKIFQ